IESITAAEELKEATSAPAPWRVHGARAKRHDLMDAETIAKALGGRKGGSTWPARCPAHDDRTPSLSLRDAHDGKAWVHCHAGCNQQEVIATLRACGLWPEGGKVSSSRTTRCTDVVRPAHQDEANRRREAALAIWLSAVQADGTLVSTYFASRGIHLSP